MSEPSKYTINANTVQITEQNSGTIIGTQTNYFGVDDALSQEMADLQQFIATLETAHPHLQTEQEAEQVVATALVQVQTQQPGRWQTLRHQMGLLKQQVLNPERHLQAAKATVVEVTKAAWEKSLLVKALITYLDKLSEDPNPGD